MYAIIEDSGTQIKVAEGDVIRVAKREMASEAATITFDRVLMLGEGGATQIGTPLVEGARVTADVLSAERSEKVIVIKFKRRKDYRRKKGHRQDFLKVKITAINSDGGSVPKAGQAEEAEAEGGEKPEKKRSTSRKKKTATATAEE